MSGGFFDIPLEDETRLAGTTPSEMRREYVVVYSVAMFLISMCVHVLIVYFLHDLISMVLMYAFVMMSAKTVIPSLVPAAYLESMRKTFKKE